MANVSWWIVSRALRVGVVGLSLGAIAGLSCLVVGAAADVAPLAGWVHWVVVVLAPVLLWVIARNDLIGDTAVAYEGRRSAYGRLLMIALLGSLIANALYFTLVLTVPVALKGFDSLTWRIALDRQIGAEQYAISLIAAMLGALMVAFWAQRKAAAHA